MVCWDYVTMTLQLINFVYCYHLFYQGFLLIALMNIFTTNKFFF